MSSKRTPISEEVEKRVLLASRRRCCICFYLKNRDEECKGQLAHLNRNRANSSFENIVWLCLDHHDAYDGRTSQSKSYTIQEVRAHRDHLYDHFRSVPKPAEEEPEESRLYEGLRETHRDELGFVAEPWRFPMWQVADQPELFAFKSANRADGVCLIERVDLPDGRTVVVCIEVAGNPGGSITNNVEDICFQICERFEIDPARLVWIEHYDYFASEGWTMVEFGTMPPEGPFAEPRWTPMEKRHWADLRLRPKQRLRSEAGDYRSKITKLFPREGDALS